MRHGVYARFVALATVAIVTVVTDANSALVRSVVAARRTLGLLYYTGTRAHTLRNVLLVTIFDIHVAVSREVSVILLLQDSRSGIIH